MSNFDIDSLPPVTRTTYPSMPPRRIPLADNPVLDVSLAFANLSDACKEFGKALAFGWRHGVAQKGIKPLGPVLTAKANRVAFAHIQICFKMMTKLQVLTMHERHFKTWTRHYNAAHPGQCLNWRRLNKEQMARAFEFSEALAAHKRVISARPLPRRKTIGGRP